MWPLWLIVAIAVGSAVTFTVTGVVVAVHVERKRHRKLMMQHNLDRNLSQYHRPHLSINDVDVSALPRPVRGSLRQSFHTPQRDSRFYTTMPSEEKIRSFPDGSADSLADVPYFTSDSAFDQRSQWLNSAKLKKKSPRRKKKIQLSISAPIASTRLSAVTETSELERTSSATLVELPTHITPKVTPEKPVIHDSKDHPPHALSADSNATSQRTSHGKMLKLRSISNGSIKALPPDCPLPPLPESLSGPFGHRTNITGSQPSVRGLENSMLNSSLPSHQDQNREASEQGQRQLTTRTPYSAFDFGWHDESTQIIKVEPDCEPSSSSTPYGHPSQRSELHAGGIEDQSLQTIDASSWAVPRNYNRFQKSTPTLSATSEADSRPLSAISLNSFGGGVSGVSTPNRSPSKMSAEGPSRPTSLNSTDLFRQSIIGAYSPSTTPDSPRSKGHRRQNCVRISGLTPVDSARKRLSSQLDRLAEAEETDVHDGGAMNVKGETAPSLKPITPNECVASELEDTPATADIPTALQVRRNNTSSKPAGVDKATDSPPDTAKKLFQRSAEKEFSPAAPWLNRSRTTNVGFRYQGSPSSDPTKRAPPQQEYSPISPTFKMTTPEKKRMNLADISYSPASPSMLNSANPSLTNSPASISAFSPRRHRTQLHGPRNIPPPSLRTRNKTSPRTRPIERSGSPIRKSSSTGSVKQSQRTASQDDLRRSLALLKNLTHAAQSPSGLPEVNVIKTNPEQPNHTLHPEPLPTRTPSSHYADSPFSATAVRGPRSRSRTLAPREPPSMFDPPRLRPEDIHPPRYTRPSPTYSPQPQPQVHHSIPPSASTVSIWEDTPPPTIPPRSPDRPQSNRSTSHTHSTSAATPAPAVERDRLWKLQQNADIITSRALALGSGAQTQNIMGSKKRKGVKVVKASEPAQTQMQVRSRSGSTRDHGVEGYGSVGAATGQRQRSHTVAAAGRPVLGSLETGRGMGTKTQQMCEGVGLGVNFGRTGLATTFVNEMERDGIGRLS